MRTNDLIKILSLEERRNFLSVIKEHKRQQLPKLYNYLLNNIDKPESWEKEALFACISEENYQKTKDYLLRNELRLLNEALEDFIAEINAIKQLATKPNYKIELLLSAWLNAGELKRFEQEWKKAFEQANAQKNYEFSLNLCSLWVDYYSQHKYPDKKSWEELKNTLEICLKHTLAANNERKAELQRRWAWVSRTLWGLAPQAELPQLIDLNHEIDQPNIPLFLNLFALSYLSQGEDKRTKIIQALNMLGDILPFRPEFLRLEFSLLNNLALEYLFIENYEEANALFERLLKHSYLEKEAQLALNILLNYCSNLANQKKFHRILELLEEKNDAISLSSRLYHRFRAIKILALLFLRNGDAAFETLQSHSIWEQPEHDYYYMRLLYVIVYYLTQDWESCQREITNIIQCVNYKAPINQEYITTAKTFRRFIQLKENPPSDKQQKQLTKLLQDIKNKRAQSFDFNNLQTLWLEEEIENWLKV